MTDIVTRLRRWAIATDAVPASDLMDEAADEIARLRGDAAVARLRLDAAQAEIARLRLTKAEPAAYAVVSDSTEEIDCEFIYPDEATAGDVALESNGGVVSLYRQPQTALTDAEREAVAAAIGWIESPGVEDEAMPEDYLPITAALRGLLERTK